MGAPGMPGAGICAFGPPPGGICGMLAGLKPGGSAVFGGAKPGGAAAFETVKGAGLPCCMDATVAIAAALGSAPSGTNPGNNGPPALPPSAPPPSEAIIASAAAFGSPPGIVSPGGAALALAGARPVKPAAGLVPGGISPGIWSSPCGAGAVPPAPGAGRPPGSERPGAVGGLSPGKRPCIIPGGAKPGAVAGAKPGMVPGMVPGRVPGMGSVGIFSPPGRPCIPRSAGRLAFGSTGAAGSLGTSMVCEWCCWAFGRLGITVWSFRNRDPARFRSWSVSVALSARL
mmetsp:Transcript_71305/g.201286  ORF Transcript_71305/g.201286 Transcript_71305/m.201286 type:complete len:286 (+) Transcript_71305:193-1050(+)